MSNTKITRKTQIAPTGKRFGRLEVIGYSHAVYCSNRKCPRWEDYWTCKCDCGSEGPIIASRFGITVSCGCFKLEQDVKRSAQRVYDTLEYYRWRDMKARCYNENHAEYCRYGKKGRKVCIGWLDFHAYRDATGKAPSPQHTLDRKDNNGHYSCGKCEECVANGWLMNLRWATKKEQSNNMSNNRYVEYKGEKLTVAQLAERAGIEDCTLWTRLFRYGWDMERAVTTPPVDRPEPK